MGARVTDLVARDHEVALIEARLAEAFAGRGRAVVVEGEAGIGKSRLVEEVLHRAPSGASILQAAGEDIERERPFGLIAEALGLTRSTDAGRRRLGRMLLGGDAGAARFRLIEEILDLLEREAIERPLILALDDLHWADAETLGVLRALTKALGDLPVLLLGTMRPSPRSAELDAFLDRMGERRGEVLALAPLDESGIGALTAQLVRATPDHTLLEAIERAHGNPLFVTEAIAALDRAGAIAVRDGVALVTGSAEVEGLPRAVLRRLTGTSPETARALQLASVLGSTFSADELRAMMGTSAAEVAGHIAEGIRSGLLEEASDRLGFRHDLVHEAIYNEIPVSVRKALHMQAARSFVAAGAPASRIAAHMSAGAGPGDVEAVGYLREAARSSLLSPSVAVELLERAIALAGPDYADREMLLAEKIVALNWDGRRDEATREAKSLLRTARDPRSIAAAHMALAQTLMLKARYQDSLPSLEAALASTDDPALEATILANLAISGAASLDKSAEAYARRAIEVGRAAGNDAAVGVAHAALAQEAVRVGDVRAVLGWWHETRANPRLRPLGGEFGLGSVWIASMSIYLADVDLTEECHAEIAEITRDVEETRTQWATFRRHVAVIRRQYLAGEWDDAAAEAEAGLVFADENGIEFGMLVIRPSLGSILLHRGDVAAADAVMLTEEQIRERGPNLFGGLGLFVRGLINEAKGEVQAALDVASRAERVSRELFSVYPAIACEYVRLALAAGSRDRAAAVLPHLDHVAGVLGIPSAMGSSLRARGLVQDDPALLRQAVDEFRRSPRLPELAAACEDAGIAAHSTVEGASLIEEALAFYEGVGAARDIARVEARLRQLGVKRGARGRRSRPTTGWDSLTRTENRIVVLVVEGLSNPDIAARLFISRNTVQTHLSHIFTKLGLSSRVELAVQAANRPRESPYH